VLAQKSVQKIFLCSKKQNQLLQGRKFPVGSYVAAIYQHLWYVGQVLDKVNESTAMPDSQYIFVNYMEWAPGNTLKWPVRADKLNTAVEDVLFACKPPTPANNTSSTRSVSYKLEKAEQTKAEELFRSKDFMTPTFSIKINKTSFPYWYWYLYQNWVQVHVPVVPEPEPPKLKSLEPEPEPPKWAAPTTLR